jgi:ABC-type phosphate transport system substrate-binding protein
LLARTCALPQRAETARFDLEESVNTKSGLLMLARGVARFDFLSVAVVCSLTGTACSKQADQAAPQEKAQPATEAPAPAAPARAPVAAPIAIDGSSTVFPISEAMAEEFHCRSPTTASPWW